MIIQKISCLDFTSANFAEPTAERFKGGFALKIGFNGEIGSDRVIFSLPNSLTVKIRTINRAELDIMNGYDRAENYFVGHEGKASVRVLEAVLTVDDPNRPNWREMKLGVTIAERGELVIYYDGTAFRILRDGITLNENFPTGRPAEPSGELYLDGGVKLGVADPAEAKRTVTDNIIDTDISYYSPFGVNTWAGDVVNFYHDGVYHLLYLLDRHHHGNRWGGGAHYFAQLTTTDFVNWTDWGAIFELEKPWQSVGTGTMFYFGDKYYMSFGWHTSRAIPNEKLVGGKLWQYYNEHGQTMPLCYADIFAEGLYPNGANLYESSDGIKFTSCGLQFHWAENPSVYNDENGLNMFCGGGQWSAETPFSPWKLVRTGFPPCGDTTMRNSDECPSFFELGGYKYLIMGVTGFWCTEKDSDTYFDSAEQGYDIYDGLCVPMAVNAGGRLICAGWLAGIGWGSVIVHRELIQYSNGHLGMKWLPESAPSSENMTAAEGAGKLESGKSYYFELDIDPLDGDGRAAVRFISSDGNIAHDCELGLDLKAETAQFNTPLDDKIAQPLEPMYIAVKNHPQDGYAWGVKPETLPHRSYNFAIAHCDVMKTPFTLKIIVRSDEKMGSTVIDAEINGQRTLISNRVGVKLFAYKSLCDGAEIRAVRVKEIK